MCGKCRRINHNGLRHRLVCTCVPQLFLPPFTTPRSRPHIPNPQCQKPCKASHRHTSKVQKCVKHNMLIPVACSFNLSASAEYSGILQLHPHPPLPWDRTLGVYVIWAFCVPFDAEHLLCSQLALCLRRGKVLRSQATLCPSGRGLAELVSGKGNASSRCSCRCLPQVRLKFKFKVLSITSNREK